MELDFTAGDFTGDITGRHEMGTLNMEGVDVVFAGTYADGVLTGAVNQGANNGALNGLLVGANGEEVIGTFTYEDYDSQFGSRVRGAFWAAE